MSAYSQSPGPTRRVAVVIPAFNAQGTLDTTLNSVRGQTHRDLEIMVVNDGSTDSTLAIAQAHALADTRVRVVSQDNAGVAVARNRGVRETTAGLLAPVDADDVWHPEKIALQVGVMDAASPTTALVYTWSATIDWEGRIVGLDNRASYQGAVLPQLARGNFLGNASCALIRRSAFEEAGGYDPMLRAAGAQGCEDWQLYLKIAQSHNFAVVPRDLTGYRVFRGNMSSNYMNMWRSHQIVAAWLLAQRPELASQIRAGDENALAWLIRRSAVYGDMKVAMALAKHLHTLNPKRAAQCLRSLPTYAFRSLVKPQARRRIKTAFGGAGLSEDPMRPGELFPVGGPGETEAAAEHRP